jgi:hypothetical protein
MFSCPAKDGSNIELPICVVNSAWQQLHQRHGTRGAKVFWVFGQSVLVILPSNIAMENGTVIVDLPIDSMAIFHSHDLVFLT